MFTIMQKYAKKRRKRDKQRHNIHLYGIFHLHSKSHFQIFIIQQCNEIQGPKLLECWDHCSTVINKSFLLSVKSAHWTIGTGKIKLSYKTEPRKSNRILIVIFLNFRKNICQFQAKCADFCNLIFCLENCYLRAAPSPPRNETDGDGLLKLYLKIPFCFSLGKFKINVVSIHHAFFIVELPRLAGHLVLPVLQLDEGGAGGAPERWHRALMFLPIEANCVDVVELAKRSNQFEHWNWGESI